MAGAEFVGLVSVIVIVAGVLIMLALSIFTEVEAAKTPRPAKLPSSSTTNAAGADDGNILHIIDGAGQDGGGDAGGGDAGGDGGGDAGGGGD